MSGTPKETGAELIVTQLNSLDQEEVYRNAEKKTVHSVIKNMPFSIELGLRGQFDPYEVDFHKFTLGCTLVYDTPDERPVDWVKMSPVDCSVQVNETCERAMVEVRLHVLSSQHEDMAFRIKFTAAAPAKSNLASLVVISEPIKVVSKLSQLKKNKKPPSARAKRAAPVAAVPDNELLVSSLARIEAQQRQQQALIDSLVQTVSILQQHRQAPAPSTPATLSVADVASPSNVFGDDDSYDEPQPRRKRVKLEPAVAEGTSSSSSSQQPSPASQDPSSLFEHHLHGLLATFSQLPAEERATCIHRVFRDQSSNASEVVEALLAESLSSTNQVDPHRPTASFDSNHFYDSNAYQIAPEAFYQHLPVPVLKQEPRTS